ncbi:Ser/Thr phosphatase family protein, partial [Cardiosporidium cionae]
SSNFKTKSVDQIIFENTHTWDEEQQESFLFLWLTDVHYDPLYDKSMSWETLCRNADNRYRLLLDEDQFPVENNNTGIRSTIDKLSKSGEFVKIFSQLQSLQRTPFMAAGKYDKSGFPIESGSATDGGVGAAASSKASTNQIVPKSASQKNIPAYWGRIGCDSPHNIIQSSFDLLFDVVEYFRSSVKGEAKLVKKEQSSKKEIEDALDIFSSSIPPSGSTTSSLKFVLFTGDFPSHYESRDLRFSAIKEFTDKFMRNFSQTYRNVPIVLTVGNNDLYNDYYILDEPNAWSEDLYALWKEFLPQDENTAKTFTTGLYYATTVKDLPSIVLLCINTQFYSIMRNEFTINPRPFRDPNDPAGQFAWMEEQLEDAYKFGKKVVIIGHIAPGNSYYYNSGKYGGTLQWYDLYARRYQIILSKFPSTIAANLFGHSHLDGYRIFSSYDLDKNNISHSEFPTLIAPSISPIHGNNPGIRLMAMSHTFGTTNAIDDPTVESIEISGNLKIADYLQFYFPLYDFKSLGTFDSRPMSPRVSYTFSKEYGLPDVTADSLKRLNRLRATNEEAFWSFNKHKYVRGAVIPSFIENCIGETVTSSGYDLCIVSSG